MPGTPICLCLLNADTPYLFSDGAASVHTVEKALREESTVGDAHVPLPFSSFSYLLREDDWGVLAQSSCKVVSRYWKNIFKKIILTHSFKLCHQGKEMEEN